MQKSVMTALTYLFSLLVLESMFMYFFLPRKVLVLCNGLLTVSFI